MPHAHLFAAQGAKVVVNDLGGARDGTGGSVGPAQTVVEEITATGGTAIANADDISSWEGAQRLIGQAIETYGRLDVLVNNAGILRDRMMVNMSEAEWDAVVKVHLKGTFAPSHFAAEHFRERSKAGEDVQGRIINTTSPSGLFGNVGQTNYGAAKAGIAALHRHFRDGARPVRRHGERDRPDRAHPVDRRSRQHRRKSHEETKQALAPEHIAPVAVWLGSTRLRRCHRTRLRCLGSSAISVAEGWAYGTIRRG